MPRKSVNFYLYQVFQTVNLRNVKRFLELHDLWDNDNRRLKISEERAVALWRIWKKQIHLAGIKKAVESGKIGRPKGVKNKPKATVD